MNNIPHWLETQRQKAANQFSQEGFPTTKNEDWKYTSLRALSEKNWQKSDAKLHFLDNGLIVMDFFSALQHYPQEMEKYLPMFFNTTHQDAFYAFNTALFHQGFVVVVPENKQVEEPIEIKYPSLLEGQMACWRNLIILKKNARVAVIETFEFNEENASFHQAITEAYVDEGAQLQHYKKQKESAKNFHISELFVKQQEHSHVESTVLSLQGGFIRSDTHVRLEAPHAHCILNGIALGQGKQMIDHHTTIEHLTPHGTSNEYYKGILKDDAHGVFNGKVIVSPQAVQTNASQNNKTLLLSRMAQMNSKPQLEIFSDDVKCTHGSTVGQLDEEALFYLQARGIEHELAQQLLIKAFFSDLLDKMSSETIKKEVKTFL